ncbi:VanZ family protein [Sulfurimonas aquatica]|uniref:VanZ family protein n=1 Tax=Sulfurimonas aquatica TaxID=2672570 RepID=A0A975GCU0_9BACT|nr:VanZ family protein [Sulfurimonas aquatica]QSZ41663.1 VanZ family protein [Sulfurimonas aquatica]
MQQFFKVALFICLIAIEYLATTTVHIEVVENLWDKANHFIAFFTLYILLTLAYKNLSLIIKVFYLLLFGVQIEIVQYFIPERYFSFLDVVADSIGILIGVMVMLFYKKVFSKINE